MEERYDVVVIGGGLAGASTALLILREVPDARVLVVEREERFGRRVGEATVEVSGFFLAHVLRLHDELSRDHLPKHGLRFWFTDDRPRSLAEMTEVGTTLVPSLPSFQLDRAVLDESVLSHAASAGARVERAARVTDVELARPESLLTIADAAGERTVRASWVVDASGRRAVLARRLGLREPLAQHPTTAVWARWDGVADMDGPTGPAATLPPVAASRRLCTNHVMGYGWWCWLIPLADGTTSIGVVLDERHAALPEGGSALERYERFVRAQDGLRELVEGARPRGGDVHLRRRLAYRSKRHAGDGWALVGDASEFLDPFYSPGLDHLSISAYATARLIVRHLRGELAGEEGLRAVREHDTRFTRSYERAYRALYEDKYEIFGDAELVAAAFHLDTSMYYLGVVHPIYRDERALALPVLCLDDWRARLALRVMRFQRRRLVALARRRRARGLYGRRNVGERILSGNFGDASLAFTRAHRRGLRLWLRAELITALSGLRRRRTVPRLAGPPLESAVVEPE